MKKQLILLLAMISILSGCSYFKSEEDRMMQGHAAERIDLSSDHEKPEVPDVYVRPQKAYAPPVEPYAPASGVLIYPLDDNMRRTINVYR